MKCQETKSAYLANTSKRTQEQWESFERTGTLFLRNTEGDVEKANLFKMNGTYLKQINQTDINRTPETLEMTSN